MDSRVPYHSHLVIVLGKKRKLLNINKETTEHVSVLFLKVKETILTILAVDFMGSL